MVFVLDDISKIESDRLIDPSSLKTYEHLQTEESSTPGGSREFHTLADKAVTTLERMRDHFQWTLPSFIPYFAFAEASSNSQLWGNKGTKGKKVIASIKGGRGGGVVYFQDEGDGFDFASSIERLVQEKSHAFHYEGNGLKRFHEETFHVAYHGNGNLISIATPFFLKQ